MNYQLLEILACPICKGKLIYADATQELICRFDKLAYPVKNDIPVMMVDSARQLLEKEI